MSLVDRFVCRREGHRPAVVITRTSGLAPVGNQYITSCLRCGKVYAAELTPASSPASPPPT